MEIYRNSVGALLLNKKKQLYFFRRIDFPDNWQGIEGGVDDGETNDIAIYREIEEEIGIVKKDLKFIAKTNDSYKYLYKNGANKWGQIGQQKQFYLFEFMGNENDLLKNIAKEVEFTDWKLVNSDEALKLVSDFKVDLYKKVLEEFKIYGL
jgi:putative (di)nucleoside polyphosphate hydrolase